jgi:hypothetical protein
VELADLLQYLGSAGVCSWLLYHLLDGLDDCPQAGVGSEQFGEAVELVDLHHEGKAMVGLEYLESEFFDAAPSLLEGRSEVLVDGQRFFEIGDVVAHQALMDVLLNEHSKVVGVAGVSQIGDEVVADLVFVVGQQADKGERVLDQEIQVEPFRLVVLAALDERVQSLHFLIRRRQSDFFNLAFEEEPQDVDEFGVDEFVEVVPGE